MRYLLLLACVFAAIAAICAMVPTQFISDGPVAWLSLAALAFFLDCLVGPERAALAWPRRPAA